MAIREVPRPMAHPLDYLDAVADLRHYEIVDGYVLMSPAPSIPHQRLLARILRAMAANAPVGVEILPSPVDWVLSEGQVRQPDVVAVEVDALRGSRQLLVPPMVAVEILSPGSEEADLAVKPALYAQAGLQHYWTVELLDDGRSPGVARIFTRDGDALRLELTATDSAIALSAPFDVTLPLQL